MQLELYRSLIRRFRCWQNSSVSWAFFSHSIDVVVSPDTPHTHTHVHQTMWCSMSVAWDWHLSLINLAYNRMTFRRVWHSRFDFVPLITEFHVCRSHFASIKLKYHNFSNKIKFKETDCTAIDSFLLYHRRLVQIHWAPSDEWKTSRETIKNELLFLLWSRFSSNYVKMVLDRSHLKPIKSTNKTSRFIRSPFGPVVLSRCVPGLLLFFSVCCC